MVSSISTQLSTDEKVGISNEVLRRKIAITVEKRLLVKDVYKIQERKYDRQLEVKICQLETHPRERIPQSGTQTSGVGGPEAPN